MYLQCIKNFEMNTGKVAFIQGENYPVTEVDIDEDEILLIVNSEIAEGHMMPVDATTWPCFNFIHGEPPEK